MSWKNQPPYHKPSICNMSNVKMPKGFWESMEGCFTYDGSKEEAIKKLLGAGFVPLPRKKK